MVTASNAIPKEIDRRYLVSLRRNAAGGTLILTTALKIFEPMVLRTLGPMYS